MTTSELVVLLGDDGLPIGSADKASVHTTDTALHLAFSCHVFNEQGQVLMTRRALTKKTWPGVWTNSACGPVQVPKKAWKTLFGGVLAMSLAWNWRTIAPALPNFRYRAVDASGIVENEVCPVFIATTRMDPTPVESEVCEWHWANPASIRAAVETAPFVFSPWLVDQMTQWEGPYGLDTSVR